ncbi:MAG: hypothetical protein QXV13_02915 [Candidatus Micrarchaeaceae archaeon]
MTKQNPVRQAAKRRHINALVSFAVFLIVILSVVLVPTIYVENALSTSAASAASSGTSGIGVHINVPGFTVASLTIGVYGNGANISVPLHIVSRCVASLPILVNITPTPGYNATNHTLILPCNSSRVVIFAGLKPFSTYTVYVNGSESTYCTPGIACPLFILRVHYNESIETQGANSIVNVTFGIE